jgi:hypothetical protein
MLTASQPTVDSTICGAWVINFTSEHSLSHCMKDVQSQTVTWDVGGQFYFRSFSASETIEKWKTDIRIMLDGTARGVRVAIVVSFCEPTTGYTPHRQVQGVELNHSKRLAVDKKKCEALPRVVPAVCGPMHDETSTDAS